MDDQDANRDVRADGQDAGQPVWTPLAALSTGTGRSVEALRKAVKRPGWDLPKRRRNDGSWEVLVGPADVRRLARGRGDGGRDVRGAKPPVQDTRPGASQGGRPGRRPGGRRGGRRRPGAATRRGARA